MKHRRYRPVLTSPLPATSSGAASFEREKLLNLKEASQLSGFSIPYLRTISQLGRLKAQKISRKWVTTSDAIEEYKNTRLIKVKKD